MEELKREGGGEGWNIHASLTAKDQIQNQEIEQGDKDTCKKQNSREVFDDQSIDELNNHKDEGQCQKQRNDNSDERLKIAENKEEAYQIFFCLSVQL